MANIDLQKKSRPAWGWLLAAIAIAAVLIIIAAVAADDDQEDQTTALNTGQPAVVSERFPAAAILANPEQWDGETVAGQVRVESVPTDRGVWVEKDGKRMFVVINPEGPAGAESDVNIREDQRLQIRNARVLRSGQAAQVSGELDQDSQRIIAEVPAFLMVDENDIEVLGEG